MAVCEGPPMVASILPIEVFYLTGLSVFGLFLFFSFFIFRRAGADPSQISGAITLSESAEKALAIKLLQFPEVIDSVATDCLPNLLCNYLFELASQFMSFYEACPVLKAVDQTRTSRLLLCVATANTLSKGLELLGIETVDQM